MKEVILYVYGFERARIFEPTLFLTTEPDYSPNFKGRMIGVETDLPILPNQHMPKEGDVVADVSGKAWLVVELCDSAMKSFADSEPSAPFEKMGRFEVNIGG